MKYLTAVLSTLLLQPPDSWDKFFDRFLYVPRLWIIIAFWYVVFIDHGIKCSYGCFLAQNAMMIVEQCCFTFPIKSKHRKEARKFRFGALCFHIR